MRYWRIVDRSRHHSGCVVGHRVGAVIDPDRKGSGLGGPRRHAVGRRRKHQAANCGCGRRRAAAEGVHASACVVTATAEIGQRAFGGGIERNAQTLRVRNVGVCNRDRSEGRLRGIVINRLPCSGASDHWRRQQTIKGLAIECCRFNLASLTLQHPVATASGRPGGVDRCSDIRTGRLREGGEKGCAITAKRDIAAIEHDVRTLRKAAGKARQLRRLTGQRRQIQLQSAQHQSTFTTMRNDMNRIDLDAGIHRIGDLRKGIACRVKHHDVDPRPDRGHDVLPARHRGIDKRNLVASRSRRCRCRYVCSRRGVGGAVIRGRRSVGGAVIHGRWRICLRSFSRGVIGARIVRASSPLRGRHHRRTVKQGARFER